MRATCIVLTKDANYNLKPLQQHFSEIILVVDSKKPTQEKVYELDKNRTVIFSRPLDHDFSAQRNEALRRATEDWVLFLDDDERITKKLMNECERAIQNRNDVGYRIPRQDQFMGRVLKHGETGSVRLLRLARRNAGYWERPVHETWNVRGAIGRLMSPILHNPHNSVESFLNKLIRYTYLEVKHRRSLGKRCSLLELLLFPPSKFMLNYFFKLGFLDGFPGLAMAYMMSLHSLIARVGMYEKKS